jgi:nucleotidyltransferase AbiEii toxin of type IV toxin-antitoxin system
VNSVELILRKVAADVATIAAPWAVVGGFAVSARCDPRFTRDVDVAIAVPDDRAAEAVVSSLGGRGYRLVGVTEQDAVGRLATARLLPSAASEGLIVDVLFASSGIEPEIAAEATDVEVVPGLVVPVAQTGHLIALKLLARDDETRPQDRADLLALVSAADQHDLDLAARACELIMVRGYGRDRDLPALLGELVAMR